MIFDEASSEKPIVKATIIANTRYGKFRGHQHLTEDQKNEWADTKEETIS